jgi:DNA polymerase-3 subunit alpha
MPHADFVHLRVHSAYSLSEGAIKIKQLIDLCRRQRMPAVAIADSGNLFGALEFALAAKDAGVQPIIACQLAIAREERGTPPWPTGRWRSRSPISWCCWCRPKSAIAIC